jgi:hypothetical protein
MKEMTRWPGLTTAARRAVQLLVFAGQKCYVIMRACRGGRPPGGRGAMRCGSPCRAGAAGVPGERSDRTSSALWPIRSIRSIATAEIASELRRGADYVRVTPRAHSPLH